MRCFIAIDIPEEIRAELADLQKELAQQVDIHKGDVKWVEPESMHLTLKFLGEVPDPQIVEICNIAKDVASRHEAFDFAVREAGSFGGRSARVLWMGAGLDCPALLELQQELEEELAEAGWPKEGRQFSGHLTLCRIRNSKAGEKLGRMVEQYKDYDLGTVRAASIVVYESRLTPQGPMYTPLGNFNLVD
ncbi:MAG: RNA 2',3'-cyclic phosphodiesterase [Planctomycetes bacterium]|nr:RNA 2',3'-cyclic phosphodiesterase [Planctomycetota bacterium]